VEEASLHCPSGTGGGGQPPAIRKAASTAAAPPQRRSASAHLLLTVLDRLGGHHSALAGPLPVPVTGPDSVDVRVRSLSVVGFCAGVRC
jgi:hypothetical protein